MTVITDYQLNPNWGWHDFTMVTGVMVIFAVLDVGMFAWWIMRNRIKIRVAGVFKFYLANRTVPLTIFDGFHKDAPNPVMQTALDPVDHYPDNMSQGNEDTIKVFKEYEATMAATQGRWPDDLPYSFELYVQYRINQSTTPQMNNTSFLDWMRNIHAKGLDRQMIGTNYAVNNMGTTYVAQPAPGMNSTQFRMMPNSPMSVPYDPRTALTSR
jgi:hypothetical protein